MVSVPTETNIQLNKDFDLSNNSLSFLKFVTQSMESDIDGGVEGNSSNISKPRTLGDVLKSGDQMSADETSSNVSTEGLDHGDTIDNQNNLYGEKENGHSSKSNSPHSGEGGINGSGDNFNDPNGSNNWGRAPGRKKTHPVWLFFKDLKDSGLDDVGIVCLHCDWKGTDKSPNNLKIHLKKCHAEDGIYEKYCEALANTPTQPYAKRKRANEGFDQPSIPSKISNNSSIGNTGINPLELFASLAANNQIGKSPTIDVNSDNFNGVFKQKTENDDPFVKQAVENQQSNLNFDTFINIAQSEVKKTEGSRLNDALKLAALNPLLFSTTMAQNSNTVTPNILAQISNNVQSSPLSIFNKNVPVTPKKEISSGQSNSKFVLADENCFHNLLSIAKDMDISMTYSYNNQHEFVFSLKDTDSRPDITGKAVVLRDYPNEVKLYERNDGSISECETFKKADWSQMHWALRGKIQNLLFNNIPGYQ
ncbi:Zinc finger, BED-type predicted domain-containing protein [Strongyloides ratti]|uniref:Zinc finger, BED-type predicted domain-containing protein n=1 Tax=Strongyloides ratti TaxID=34506 RepID=A0A090LRG0_STRRB|nr:Zinc finger, BED-type predicted domain-containing protein [Strongyloides ratti]CEF70176.1 Zinc finger, BED-type predicted domain-containing protein [Strongyloides ratti]